MVRFYWYCKRRIIQFLRKVRSLHLIFLLSIVKNNDTQKITDIKYENRNDTQNDTQKNRIKIILDLVKEKPNITIKEICLKLKVSRPTIYRDMKYLKENNVLEYQGSSKKGKWIIKK